LQNEELFDFYFSSDIINVIKLRRMRWAGHAAYGRGERCILNSGAEALGKEITWKN
jgi:hypothetical protein